MKNTKLEEIGCDWLTGTTGPGIPTDNASEAWEELLRHYDIKQAWRRKASWMGYLGERIEHGFFGTRPDGACVILSGPLAYEQAREFLILGARPSRLDLQETGTIGEPVGPMIEQMFNISKDFTGALSRPPRLKMFIGRKGVEGLYVGSRASSVMLRIYDKGLESGQKVYQGCLRIEAELKQDTAISAVGHMLAEENETEFIGGLLNGLLVQRGLPTPFLRAVPPLSLVSHHPISTIEAKAEWLRRQVSPTVMAMVEELGTARVLAMLMPDSLTKQAGEDTIIASS